MSHPLLADALPVLRRILPLFLVFALCPIAVVAVMWSVAMYGPEDLSLLFSWGVFFVAPAVTIVGGLIVAFRAHRQSLGLGTHQRFAVWVLSVSSFFWGPAVAFGAFFGAMELVRPGGLLR
jgi:hypothetical protein